MRHLFAILMGFFMCLSGCASAPAGPKAPFKFVNNTDVWLAFYVDGVKVAGVDPGHEAQVEVVVGNHTVRAESSSGKRSAEHSGEITTTGGSWTVNPPGK